MAEKTSSPSDLFHPLLDSMAVVLFSYGRRRCAVQSRRYVSFVPQLEKGIRFKCGHKSAPFRDATEHGTQNRCLELVAGMEGCGEFWGSESRCMGPRRVSDRDTANPSTWACQEARGSIT